MSAPIFVDTNVLISAIDSTNARKQKAAFRWREVLWKSRRGRISFQVVQEFYVNVIRKWPSARDEAQAEVRDLMAWTPIAPDRVMIERAWKFQDRYQLSFWDALIVAAAKSSACGYLLTEDMQANQDLDGILVVNPFMPEAETLCAW
jgi:predicted nucleic acid-binding protein